jgi:hypothetical protein
MRRPPIDLSPARQRLHADCMMREALVAKEPGLSKSKLNDMTGFRTDKFNRVLKRLLRSKRVRRGD